LAVPKENLITVSKPQKKSLALEEWDSTNKNATVRKCRQLYKVVLLSVVGSQLKNATFLEVGAKI